MKTIAFLSTETQRRFRKSAEQAGISMNYMGYANGYVALPPDHPLHGMNYDRIYQVADISVWGGLTFSEYRRDCQHDPQWVEIITDSATFDAIPDDWWVLGFDTMHFGDGPNHDRQWCVRETRMLQLHTGGHQVHPRVTSATAKSPRKIDRGLILNIDRGLDCNIDRGLILNINRGRPENAKVRFFRKKVRLSEKKVRFTETTHRRAHDRQTAPHREEG